MPSAIFYPHIIKEDGKPARLENHPRVRVAQIVMDYLAYGWSADEIRRQHPHLALAEVHAAMGYYYDNQTELDAEIAAELEEADRALAAGARSPVWLRLKAQHVSFLKFLDDLAARPLQPGLSVGPFSREELSQRGVSGH